jgi:hypothetical protein
MYYCIWSLPNGPLICFAKKLSDEYGRTGTIRRLAAFKGRPYRTVHEAAVLRTWGADKSLPSAALSLMQLHSFEQVHFVLATLNLTSATALDFLGRLDRRIAFAFAFALNCTCMYLQRNKMRIDPCWDRHCHPDYAWNGPTVQRIMIKSACFLAPWH